MGDLVLHSFMQASRRDGHTHNGNTPIPFRPVAHAHANDAIREG